MKVDRVPSTATLACAVAIAAWCASGTPATAQSGGGAQDARPRLEKDDANAASRIEWMTHRGTDADSARPGASRAAGLLEKTDARAAHAARFQVDRVLF